MSKRRVSIAGVTGYTGIELARLLSTHPHIEFSQFYSDRFSGKRLSDVYPQFRHTAADRVLQTLDPAEIPDTDVLFLALPAGVSHRFMGQVLDHPIRVVDLSPDFRLATPELYQHHYGFIHESPQLLSEAVIGFSEIYPDKIKTARLIANPGCYATAVSLALWPMAVRKLLFASVIADAKSGVTGAGRSLKESSLFCEVSGTFGAYGLSGHRHVPEMESIAGVSVVFTPHLVPMNRGILATVYVDNARGLTTSELVDIFRASYSGMPFVDVAPELSTPNTKYVSGSNRCILVPKVDERTGRIIIFSMLDNLIKGASGQAIQNMNIMCNFSIEDGLLAVPHYI